MELTRKALLRAAVAFAFAWACTPEEQDPDDEGSDAGSDGGPGGDAGHDAGPGQQDAGGGDGGPDAGGPDGGHDAGHDAGPEDAGHDAGQTGPSCTENGTVVDIQTNHGHTLTVSKEDVIAGVEKTYDITGSSGHTHAVTLTAGDFAALAANNAVVVTSTEGSFHTHEVTVSCA